MTTGSSFFLRVTREGEELITAERKARIRNNEMILEFLKFIFIRKPDCRPTLKEVIIRFEEMVNQTAGTKFQRLGKEFGKTAVPVFIVEGREAIESILELDNIPYLHEGFENQATDNDILYTTLSMTNGRNGIHGYEYETDTQYFSQHVTKVNNYIYFGNELSTKNKDFLRELDITHVLCCSLRQANPSLVYYFDYTHIPLVHQPPSDQMFTNFEKCVEFIKKAKKVKGKIFIHNNGRSPDPSVTLVIAYLMEIKNLGYYEAYNIVQRQNYTIKPDYKDSIAKHLIIQRKKNTPYVATGLTPRFS